MMNEIVKKLSTAIKMLCNGERGNREYIHNVSDFFRQTRIKLWLYGGSWEVFNTSLDESGSFLRCNLGLLPLSDIGRIEEITPMSVYNPTDFLL
jgi:hypothetical protein